MYTVAYNDGWETQRWYYSSKRNSEKKIEEICERLNIYTIPLNTRPNLSEGWLEWSEIITEEQKQKGIFSSETKPLYNKRNKHA